MSFRSVSILPTCLHPRLALSHPSRLRSLATCARCQYNTAQVQAIKDGNTQGRLIKAVSSKVPEVPIDSGLFEVHRDISLHKAAPDSLRKKQQCIEAASISTPAARVGATFQVPSFAHGDPSQVKPTRDTQTANEHERTLAHVSQDENIAQEYREWDELHDKFLEVRRTRPDQTKTIFCDQINLVKNVLGDSVGAKDSSARLKQKWETLTRADQKKLLPQLLIGSLSESAATTLLVLESIQSIPFAFMIRMNCLRSIGIMHRKELQQEPEVKQLYEQQITYLRSADVWPKNKLPTVLLQNLLFWSTSEQCSTIIKDFFNRYPDAEPSSLIAIIDHYLRIEDRESAFAYFRRLPADMLYQPDQIILKLRDRLLRMDVVAKGESGTNFKYLPQLLALGIPSDEALHNTVIESAILNGLPDIAWDLYQYLESSQFVSNARSHLVLLRDAFRRGDLDRVNKVMTAIHGREDLIGDQYLMAYSMNIVRIISCYDKQLGSDEARSHIMALYDRAYSRAALTRLNIVQPIKNSGSQSIALPEPSPTLLAFTVWTYILIQRYDGNVLRLWQWIQHQVSTGDQAVICAMQFDVIYHGLILYHARRARTLFRALEVMQYMLSTKLCLPTPRTWSILLCAYLRHDQVEQAEKVMALMYSKGFKVEEVNEKFSDYVPVGHDLQALADRVSQSLDEKKMPEGLEELLATSGSLQDEKRPLMSGSGDLSNVV